MVELIALSYSAIIDVFVIDYLLKNQVRILLNMINRDYYSNGSTYNRFK